MVGDMRKLVDKLRSRNYKGLRLNTHIFPDITHFSIWGIAINRGLKSLFSANDLANKK